MYCCPVVGHVATEVAGTGNAVPEALCIGRSVSMRPQSLAVAAIRKFRTTRRLSSQRRDLIHSLSFGFCSSMASRARLSMQVLPGPARSPAGLAKTVVEAASLPVFESTTEMSSPPGAWSHHHHINNLLQPLITTRVDKLQTQVPK